MWTQRGPGLRRSWPEASCLPLFLHSLLLPGKLRACPQSREWFPNRPPQRPIGPYCPELEDGGSWGRQAPRAAPARTRSLLQARLGLEGGGQLGYEGGPGRRCPTRAAFLAHPGAAFQGLPETPARIRSGGFLRPRTRREAAPVP